MPDYQLRMLPIHDKLLIQHCSIMVKNLCRIYPIAPDRAGLVSDQGVFIKIFYKKYELYLLELPH